MRDVVIVSAVRTPVGSFGGVFKDVSAVELGVVAVKEAIKRANISPDDIEEVIIGNVLQAGLGQNIARQIAIKSEIPETVPSYALNKLCGSGLKAVALAAATIKAGDADVVVAGGVENMSQAPYLIPSNRFGQKMGHSKVLDSMILDGLTDAFHNYHMGVTAENIVKKYGFTREQLDEFAVESQNKAEKAIKENKFKEEIAPVSIKQRKGDPIIVDKDEYPKFGVTMETLAKLKPAFEKDGVVTAGNSSGLNDGAAMLILMSKEKAQKLGVKILAEIKSYASMGVDPQIMGVGPISSTKKALEKANLKIEDLDLIEANEAFAAQSLSVIKDLGLDTEKVNVNGGAIALGHPIGASGARILVTLIHEMEKRNLITGLATLCVGGGQGTSVIISR